MILEFHVISEVAGFDMNLLNHSCYLPNCKTIVTANDSNKLVAVEVAICDIPVNTELILPELLVWCVRVQC